MTLLPPPAGASPFFRAMHGQLALILAATEHTERARLEQQWADYIAAHAAGQPLPRLDGAPTDAAAPGEEDVA